MMLQYRATAVQPFCSAILANEVIDKIENLCNERALTAFGLDEKRPAVLWQPSKLCRPSGEHLTHGYYTAKKKISATSICFESPPYSVHPETGIIEYEELRQQALIFRPATILCGASACPRTIDFARFRAIADEVGDILMADIAHMSGLVATKQHPSPFEHCDVVTRRRTSRFVA